MTPRALEPLPVDPYLDEVRHHLATSRAVVVSAAPGSGKTTRIPPAIADSGPVILLQPRRVAARAVARRIADERGWTVGQEVGWQIRFERRSTSDTRLLVVTEGILTARLQNDPLLSDFTTVVFDEFHERSIHSDLGLALARQAWLARDELKIVVMSATLDGPRIAKFFGGCPVVSVPGQIYPLTIEYAEGESVATAARNVLSRTAGDVLCFLPGVAEIERAQRELASFRHELDEVEVVPLHGSVDGETQDRALRRAAKRRIILATNIAETSLTVPGVSAVVDSGYHKVARYDSARGVDSLTLERISRDAADQRAGRAARLGPGLVRRLWDPRQRLSPHRQPDIVRLDLAGPVLYLLAWGAHPERFEWFEAPPPQQIADALRLLERLGAIDAQHRLTTPGGQMLRVPMHPRLARILIEGRGAPEVVTTCARLSGDPAVAPTLQRVVTQFVEGPVATSISDVDLRHALFTGYADRLARRRPEARERAVLATGHGAVIGRECEPFESEYFVALDVAAASRGGATEAIIRSASPVEAEWITPTATIVEHRLDHDSGRVRAYRVRRYDALVLSEHPTSPDPLVAADLLAAAWLTREADDPTRRLLRRARFAEQDLDLATLVRDAAFGATALDEIDIASRVPFDIMRRINDAAPESVLLPSGRRARVDYGDDGSVSVSVKLQEVFGLADSPRLGPQHVPLTFHLLAPNGRPVQATRDLRSFWQTTYAEVRKELRARYPKHPWPEDPWSATPTDRPTRRGAR